MAANEYPFRPVVSYRVDHDSIVTMAWGYSLIVEGVVTLLVLIMIMIWYYLWFKR